MERDILSQNELSLIGKAMRFLGILVITPGNEPDYIRGLNPLSWIMIILYAVLWVFICLFSKNRVQDLFKNTDLENIKLW